MDKKLKSVIFVDDDEIIGMISKRLLEYMQITEEVLVFSDSLKALTFLKEKYATSNIREKGPADLILLDIEMPGFGAYKILNTLTELEKTGQADLSNVYFTIVTSHKTEREIKASSQYDILALLEKPLRQEEIRDLISKIP